MAYANLLYHIAFSTKQRRPFMPDSLMPRLSQYVGGIVRNLKGQLLSANGAADHLHLAVVLRPVTAVADFVGTVKSNSSRWIHDTFGDLRDFAWQDGYGAFTVSKSVLPDVIAYIENQAEHHRKMTFQEEFLALLKRHDVEYDDRYIWR